MVTTKVNTKYQALQTIFLGLQSTLCRISLALKQPKLTKITQNYPNMGFRWEFLNAMSKLAQKISFQGDTLCHHRAFQVQKTAKSSTFGNLGPAEFLLIPMVTTKAHTKLSGSTDHFAGLQSIYKGVKLAQNQQKSTEISLQFFSSRLVHIMPDTKILCKVTLQIPKIPPKTHCFADTLF